MNEKLILLISELFEKTRSGALAWAVGVASGEYLATFPGYYVLLAQIESEFDAPDGSEDYSITICKINGEIVESFTDVEIGKDLPKEKQIPFYNMVKNLYVLARRSTKGTDKALDEILRSLSK